MGLSRLAAGMATVMALAGLPLALAPTVAGAAPVDGHGYEVPAQPYKDNPDKTDWLGSYQVGGNQVWCVQFAYKAPNSDEKYQPGDALKDKWGAVLPDDIAADISYLLLRYGGTTSDDDASALAHLLHTWTSGVPAGDPRLAPTNTFKQVGYDIASHLAALPAGAKAAVDRLKADAEANRGPWTAEITPPNRSQTIGTADKWTLRVTNAKGKGVGGVPVKLTVTDATVAATTVTTPDDGGPVAVDVTPTGPNPSVSYSLDSPADRPIVQQPVDVNTQLVMSTGGEKQLTGAGKTAATAVPVVIPAGGQPVIVSAAVTTRVAPAGLAGFGVLVLLALSAAGLLSRRSARRVS